MNESGPVASSAIAFTRPAVDTMLPLTGVMPIAAAIWPVSVRSQPAKMDFVPAAVLPPGVGPLLRALGGASVALGLLAVGAALTPGALWDRPLLQNLVAAQKLLLIERHATYFSETVLSDVTFVPLLAGRI